MSTATFDALFKQFRAALPGNVDIFRQDMEKNLQAAMHAAFSNMRLVSREEFEIQRELLQRTRAKVDALEQRVNALEQERMAREPAE